MGNCLSSSTTTEKSEKQTTYKRSSKTPATSTSSTHPKNNKPSTTTTTKTKPAQKLQNGRSLNENAEQKRVREEDARKAAGDAAQRRLQEQKLKNGKLGQKLEKEKLKSKQAIIKQSAQENLQQKTQDPLVYD